MSGPKAILFDVDDTLCATTEFARRARRNAVRGMIGAGLNLDEDAVYTELEEVISEFSTNYEHHFDKLLLRLGEEHTGHLNRALVIASGVAAYHDTKFSQLRPFPGVHELLTELKQVGLRLGVITHGLAVKQAEKLIRLKLLPYFDPDAIFISGQIGISKPNPKLYQFALNAMGLQPHEAMYVGDNPLNDIVPPKSLGMITVWARAAAKQLTDGEQADHVIENFDDLGRLLRDEYGLPVKVRPRT